MDVSVKFFLLFFAVTSCLREAPYIFIAQFDKSTPDLISLRKPVNSSVEAFLQPTLYTHKTLDYFKVHLLSHEA